MQHDNSLARSNEIDEICDGFEKQMLAGESPRIEDKLQDHRDVDQTCLLRELLLIEFEVRRKRGDNFTVAEYSSRFPEHEGIIGDVLETIVSDSADLADTVDFSLSPADETCVPNGSEVEASFVPGSTAPPESAQSADAAGQRFGDYELLHEIARGGMGVIYKARQISLNRIVALKRIKSGELAGDEEIHRFHTEAEAAAQLDHPHIVPIYEVGKHDSLHFFSMGFVDGRGLDARLKDGPLPPREAAELIKTIADAIQYAHDKGIVHRDLKPANVLTDADGKPRVTDFGLAKNIAGDSCMTATGQVMGTPSYMPPEQASGNTEEIGPLADVYSLGAILYALLTGRPPFQAANVLETLKQVLEREPVSPRALNPAIDRDLETICLKCLEKQAAARYATAAALAEDLQRFLAGRPILARPIGPMQRSWRWCRRNRLATLAIALGLVLAVGGPIAALRQRQLRNEADHNAEAYLEQRERADGKVVELSKAIADLKTEERRSRRNLDHAVAVVEDFLTRVGQEGGVLSRYPNTQRIRREILEKARDYYITFVKENRAAGLSPRIAAANFRLGNIYALLGAHEQALASFQDALTIERQLARQNPGNAERQDALAATLHNLGIVLQTLARPKDAAAAFAEALAIRRTLARRHPDDARFRVGIARLHNSVGGVHVDAGKSSQALEAYRAARERWKNLVAADPQNPLYRSELARVHFNIALQNEKQNARAKALADYEQSRVLRDRLAKDFPQEAGYRDDLAATLHNMGLLLDDMGRLQQAAASLQNALRIRDLLSRENPSVPDYANGLAKLHHSNGTLLLRWGKHAQALAAFDKAISIRESLVSSGVATAAHRESLAKSLSMRADLLTQSGRRREARSALHRALAIRQELANAAPGVYQHAFGLAKAQTGLGDFNFDSGELASALQHYAGAMKIVQRLAERDASNAGLQDYLATLHRSMGIVYRRQHQLTAAAAQFRAAFKLRTALHAAHPNVDSYAVGLAGVHESLGHLYRDGGRPDDALREYELGLEHWQRLAKRAPTLPEYRVGAALLRSAIARIHADRGRRDAAIQQQQAVLQIWIDLAQKHPAVVRYRDETGAAHNNLAITYRNSGRFREAETHYASAIAIQKKLVEEAPDSTEFQRSLAKSYNNRADLQRARRNAADALATFRQAEVIQRKLVRRSDGKPEYHDDLALTLANIGGVLGDLRRFPEAVNSLQEAIAISTRLSKKFPAVARYHARLGVHYFALGNVYYEQNKTTQALKAFEHCIAIQSALQKTYPQQAKYGYDLAATLNNAGRILGRAGRISEARKHFEQALGLRKELLKRFPDSQRYRLGVAWTQLNLGILLRDSDQSTALLFCARAVSALSALRKRQPQSRLLRDLLRDAHWARGTIYNDQKNFPRAEIEWRAAAGLAHRRFGVSDSLYLGYALAQNGNCEDAVRIARQLAGQLHSGASCYRCARLYAVCAAQESRSSRGSAADAAGYCRSAVGWLRQAHDAGYFKPFDNRDRLRTDPDFRVLFNRPDFQKLLHEIDPAREDPVPARKPRKVKK